MWSCFVPGNLPPTFYCYGTRDPFYEQFLANADAAQEAGVAVERLQLDGMPHGFGASGDWIPAYDRWLTEVFQKHSKPVTGHERRKRVRFLCAVKQQFSVFILRRTLPCKTWKTKWSSSPAHLPDWGRPPPEYSRKTGPGWSWAPGGRTAGQAGRGDRRKRRLAESGRHQPGGYAGAGEAGKREIRQGGRHLCQRRNHARRQYVRAEGTGLDGHGGDQHQGRAERHGRRPARNSLPRRAATSS